MTRDLPNETWLDILLFLTRLQLSRTVSLVNRRFHELVYPKMHEQNPRKIHVVYVYGDDSSPNGFYVEFSKIEAFCISLDVDPPSNIIGIEQLYIVNNVNSEVINFLKFLVKFHKQIDTVVFYDDNQREAWKSLPIVAELHPEFFTSNAFSELELGVRGSAKNGKELGRPRRAFSHPAVLRFPRVSTVVLGEPYRHGPIANWLHWQPKNDEKPTPNRLIRIFLVGAYSETFLGRLMIVLAQRFVLAKKKCPLTVVFRTLPWFESTWLAPFERANERTGEMFVVEELEEDSGYPPVKHMRTFRVQRRPL